MKIPTLFLMIFLTGSFAFSETKPSDPVDQLTNISYFAFGGIGAAGTISEGEKAFKQVLARKEAEKDFLHLIKNGNTQGKCYALMGLHLVNPPLAVSESKKMDSSKILVQTIGGCMISSQSMQSVILNIITGRYDRYIKPKK